METTLLSKSRSKAQENLLAYFASHDPMYVTEDAIFKNLSTGEVYKGREEIGAMLHYIYHIAFDARAELVNYMITEDKAMIEGIFKGKHIGEFAGLSPTGKDVRVPLCVTYLLKDALIEEAHIYMLTDVLMNQLNSSS